MEVNVKIENNVTIATVTNEGVVYEVRQARYGLHIEVMDPRRNLTVKPVDNRSVIVNGDKLFTQPELIHEKGGFKTNG